MEMAGAIPYVSAYLSNPTFNKRGIRIGAAQNKTESSPHCNACHLLFLC
jgi:hypothetical protein